jgi:hypothetical protein
MATWISTNKVAKFPIVIAAYKRAGGGMNGGPAVAAKGFLKTVRAALTAGSAWVRYNPGTVHSWQNSQVDVTSIPGVPALRDNGKKTTFVA